MSDTIDWNPPVSEGIRQWMQNQALEVEHLEAHLRDDQRTASTLVWYGIQSAPTEP